MTGCFISSDRDAWPRTVTGLISVQHSTFRGIIKTSVPVIWTVIVTCHLTWSTRPSLPQLSSLSRITDYRSQREISVSVCKSAGSKFEWRKMNFCCPPVPMSRPLIPIWSLHQTHWAAQGRGVLPGPRCLGLLSLLSLWKMDNLHICEYLGIWAHLTPDACHTSPISEETTQWSGRGRVTGGVLLVFHMKFASH